MACLALPFRATRLSNYVVNPDLIHQEELAVDVDARARASMECLPTPLRGTTSQNLVNGQISFPMHGYVAQ